MSPAETYDWLLSKHGGDYGEAFNTASAMRGDSTDPQDVQLERIAETADQPLKALVASPYESMKGIEQWTGVPVLSKTVDWLGLPQGWKPGEGTSPASTENVNAAYQGALKRIFGELSSRFR